MSHKKSNVILSMGTYRPLDGVENARPFFKLLEDFGSTFVPQFIGGDRLVHYRTGDYEYLAGFWKAYGFTVECRHPARVRLNLILTPELSRAKGSLNSVSISIPASRLDSWDRLAECLHVGNRLYDFLSPFYGEIDLPWLAITGASWQPQWGLSGFGWATWLGPEYEDLVSIPDHPDLSIRRLPDDGRLFVCGQPTSAIDEAPSVIRAYEHVIRHVDPDVVQPPEASPRVSPWGVKPLDRRYDFLEEVGKRAQPTARKLRLPRFRFLEPSGDQIAAEEGSPFQPVGNYGPHGFTRTPHVRAILDDLEPELIAPGVPNGVGGAFYFGELTVEDARKLLQLLPPGQAEDALESSPTFKQMVQLGERFPYVKYFGYRVKPGPGERITIEGFSLPQGQATPEVVRAIKELNPAEMKWETLAGEKIVIVKWE